MSKNAIQIIDGREHATPAIQLRDIDSLGRLMGLEKNSPLFNSPF